MGKLPPALTEPLRQLMRDREATYGHVPFLVSVRVEGDSLADVRLVAEARKPVSL